MNREDSLSGFVGGVSDLRKISNEMKRYAENLKTIDTGQCPADFSAAFAIYVQKNCIRAEAIQKISHPDDPFSMIGGVLEIGTNGEQYDAECREAEDAMYELARKYGAKVPSDD